MVRTETFLIGWNFNYNTLFRDCIVYCVYTTTTTTTAAATATTTTTTTTCTLGF